MDGVVYGHGRGRPSTVPAQKKTLRSIYLSVCPSMYLSFDLSSYRYIYRSVYRSISLSVGLRPSGESAHAFAALTAASCRASEAISKIYIPNGALPNLTAPRAVVNIPPGREGSRPPPLPPRTPLRRSYGLCGPPRRMALFLARPGFRPRRSAFLEIPYVLDVF